MNYVCKETQALLENLKNIVPAAAYQAISKNVDDLVLAVNSQNEKHRKFAEGVKRMRDEQKKYFAQARAKNWEVAKGHLAQAKVYEKDVDIEADEIITGAKQIVMF